MLAVAACDSHRLFAQEVVAPDTSREWRLGLYAGPAYAWHSGVRVFGSREHIDRRMTASGTGPDFGAQATIHLNPSWRLDARLGLKSLHAIAVSNGLMTRTFLRTLGDDPGRDIDTVVPIDYRTALEYPMLEASVVYLRDALRLGRSTVLSIGFGTSVSLVIESRARATIRIAGPENMAFANPDGFPTENNGRSLVVYEYSLPGVEPFRISLLGGLEVSHELSGSHVIGAREMGDVPLTTVYKRGEDRAYAVAMHLYMQWRFDNP